MMSNELNEELNEVLKQIENTTDETLLNELKERRTKLYTNQFIYFINKKMNNEKYYKQKN